MICTHDQWLCLECVKETICKAEYPLFELLATTIIKVHDDQKCDRCGQKAYNKNSKGALLEIMVTVKLSLKSQING